MNAAFRKKVFKKSKSLIGEKRTRKLQNLPHKMVNGFKRPPFAKVSNFTVIEGFGFFMTGWLVDLKKPVSSMRVEFANGNSFNLDSCLKRLPRKDIQTRFALPAGSTPPGFTLNYREEGFGAEHGCRAQLVLTCQDGSVKRIRLNPVYAAVNPLDSVKNILNAVPSNIPEKRDLFDESYGPAIDSIWSLRNKGGVGAEVIAYNVEEQSAKPAVSLIVPIYGRYDFIEYQLAQFVNDPHMHNQDLVYVVDDPRIHDEVKTVCSAYEKLYRFPFRVVYLERNMGFAGANNAGVAYANAPMLLLLNSDVMPASKGWLSQIIESCGKDIESSVYGVRLVYEDDSIQHDGMKYHASEFVNNLWTNIHPGKGLPSSLVPKNSANSEVEAVTGACMFMTKANFEQIGGFDENFILGDYEDSDLCMRFRQAGLKIQMFREISLFHLERQSQSLVTEDRWKNELTYYNCWYHTRKWQFEIENLKNHENELIEPAAVSVAS